MVLSFFDHSMSLCLRTFHGRIVISGRRVGLPLLRYQKKRKEETKNDFESEYGSDIHIENLSVS